MTITAILAKMTFSWFLMHIVFLNTSSPKSAKNVQYLQQKLQSKNIYTLCLLLWSGLSLLNSDFQTVYNHWAHCVHCTELERKKKLPCLAGRDTLLITININGVCVVVSKLSIKSIFFRFLANLAYFSSNFGCNDVTLTLAINFCRLLCIKLG